jgi:predicted metal-dependent phosphotriesterase family hydrolase
MRNGVSKDVIDELLVRNPARLLASQAPGSAA